MVSMIRIFHKIPDEIEQKATEKKFITHLVTKVGISSN